MSLPNYRITFLHSKECDYWGKNRRGLQAESCPTFREWADQYYPIIAECLSRIRYIGINDVWWFHEPFIEITWLTDEPEKAEKAFAVVEAYLSMMGITDYHRHYPTGGQFADWFCVNEEERLFGAKRHVLSAQWVLLYRQHQQAVDTGMGVRAQVGRTIHTICNPLGLNYKDEAKICFSRGLICLLFCWLPFSKARWVYKHVFRQPYP